LVKQSGKDYFTIFTLKEGDQIEIVQHVDLKFKGILETAISNILQGKRPYGRCLIFKEENRIRLYFKILLASRSEHGRLRL